MYFSVKIFVRKMYCTITAEFFVDDFKNKLVDIFLEAMLPFLVRARFRKIVVCDCDRFNDLYTCFIVQNTNEHSILYQSHAQ